MKALGGLLVVCVIATIIYGSSWAAKNLSYIWWYEDLVKQTVKELVKTDSLKDSQK